jgi:hypothetical protein
MGLADSTARLPGLASASNVLFSHPGVVASMTRLARVSVAGPIVLVGSWVAMQATPSPWDLFFLVVGVACVPLWCGLFGLGSGAWQWYRGPHRITAALATFVGLTLVLVSGRVLLAIFGWH